ncbi:MAG: hypothetical protein EPO23_05705 [Xanthobacteraceae bacterium]|nr:MAG: hypothetical protein EPO23_05705 [Xanthobacteraceae bacterium]
MFGEQIEEFKRGVRLSLDITLLQLAAAVAVALAVVLFATALFIWLMNQYGAIIASVTIGCGFLAIAGIVMLQVAFLRRKQQLRQQMKHARTVRADLAWLNPATITLGLNAAQLIGKRRGASVVAGALLAVWYLLGRGAKPAHGEDARDEKESGEP